MPTARKTPTKRSSSSKSASRPKRKSDSLSRLTKDLQEITASIATLMSHMMPRQSRKPLPEYARVVASGNDLQASEVRGMTGIVLDAAEVNGVWTYTVYFPTRQEAYVLPETSLWDTGETVPEDVIYGGGETRRVRVDARGNGSLLA